MPFYLLSHKMVGVLFVEKQGVFVKIQVWWGNLKERDHIINGRIITLYFVYLIILTTICTTDITTNVCLL